MNQPNQCPFHKANTWITRLAKKTLPSSVIEEQRKKHQAYVEILRKPFELNKSYFTDIDKFINLDDVTHFQSIKNNRVERTAFLLEKLKNYFWNGFSFGDSENLTSQEQVFKTIGDLGLEDVAVITDEALFQKKDSDSLENILDTIWEETKTRLKNNVLVDSILHLEEFREKFPKLLITSNREKAAKVVSSILEKCHLGNNRFSRKLVALVFQKPMTEDKILVEEEGVRPQITFGCPIINLNDGEVFNHFVVNFMRCFLGQTRL